MSRPAKDVLREAVTAAAEGLFAHYDVSIEPAEAQSYCIAALCGYSSDEVRGSLGIAGTDDFASRFYTQAMGSPPTPEQEDDWIAEMSNQLLGRVKTHLLRHEVTLSLATPGVLRGIELRLGGSHGFSLHEAAFTCEFGQFCVWLDARHHPELLLEPLVEHVQDDDMALEGDMLLF